MKCRDQILHGFHGVWLKIAPAYDALVGKEIDEYQRPVSDRSDAGNDRPL